VRRARRIYEALLHAYPERTRLVRGEDMAQLFTDQLRDAGTPVDRARVWIDALTDIARTAPREHIEWRRRVRVIDGPIVEATGTARRDTLITLTPLLVAFALLAVSPPGYDVMFDGRVSVAGLPFGVAALLGGAVLAGIGLLVALRNPFADPGVQALVMGVMLAPVPALWVLGEPGTKLATYAIGAVLLVLVMQFRRAMLALVVPFVAWILLGPALIGAIIGIGARA
jgi:hypothetical protein